MGISMAEANHMAEVVELGCIVCTKVHGVTSPAEIHHIVGDGKRSHFKVLPLCFHHHRGGKDEEPISRHPYKARFVEAYGTEQDLLNEVLQLIKGDA